MTSLLPTRSEQEEQHEPVLFSPKLNYNYFHRAIASSSSTRVLVPRDVGPRHNVSPHTAGTFAAMPQQIHRCWSCPFFRKATVSAILRPSIGCETAPAVRRCCRSHPCCCRCCHCAAAAIVVVPLGPREPAALVHEATARAGSVSIASSPPLPSFFSFFFLSFFLSFFFFFFLFSFPPIEVRTMVRKPDRGTL